MHLEPRLTMFNGKLVVMQLISHNATLAAIWKSVLREDNTLSYCECRIISYCDTLRRSYVWVCKWHISACLFDPLLSLSNHFLIPTLIFNPRPQLSYFFFTLFLPLSFSPRLIILDEWNETLVQTIVKSLNNRQI